MKEGLTSVDVATIVKELSSLRGARIEKVYQSGNEIRLKLSREKRDLVIDSRRIHLTGCARKAPRVAPSFAMLMRKHLRGVRIEDIKQHDFDRIVEIYMSRREEKFLLIVELFSNGNVILLDENRRILFPFKHMSSKAREIRKGEEYKFPLPLLNPLDISREALVNSLSRSNGDVVRTLAHDLSMGGLYAEEVCIRSGIDKNMAASDLSEEQIDLIHENLIGMLEPVRSNKLSPHIVLAEDTSERPGGTRPKMIDALPFELNLYEKKEKRYFGSFNDALDGFFWKKGIEQESMRIMDEKIGFLERRMEKQEEDIDRFRLEEMECIKKAEAIYENYGEIEDEIKNRKEKEIILSVSGLNIRIDTALSIHQNAHGYYDRAKHLRRKIKGAEVALEKTKRMIEERLDQFAKAKVIEEEMIAAPAQPARKMWYEKFRWFISSDGFLVIGGRDASTNEMIVKKYMEKEDIFFHSQLKGPVVIIKTEGREVPARTLEEAAIFTVSYSGVWKDGFHEGDCYCVHADQVSKTPKSGEYIRKGGFIIRGKRNYFKVPTALSIGIETEENRLIGGPSESIKKRVKYAVEIEPGDFDWNEMSKIISKMLLDVVTEKDRNAIKSVLLMEEITRLLPPGGSGIKLRSKYDGNCPF
jgi:predicted ribosome quality control (RQC) complex YloA/Tae2 family protein